MTDPRGEPLTGFSLDDCDEIFGDSLDRVITWQGKSDTSLLAGRPVRLRIVLRDAELYSFQFRE